MPELPPILAGKDFSAPSVFEPENLLREARRQKNVPLTPVPEICLLDPDGDILRTLVKAGRIRRCDGWACYHTELYEFEHANETLGIIGCAVGASFAVLLAEQLFVSGCRLLLSMTSAGQILEKGPPPYFMLIDRALRDESTSYHYLPPADFVEADERLVEAAMQALSTVALPIHRGPSWTTDAPFRETAAASSAAVRAKSSPSRSGSPLCIRSGPPPAGAVLRTCHKPNGGGISRTTKPICRNGPNNRLMAVSSFLGCAGHPRTASKGRPARRAHDVGVRHGRATRRCGIGSRSAVSVHGFWRKNCRWMRSGTRTGATTTST